MAVPPQFFTSLERLVTASQGVVSKRIDLAMLEGRQLLSRSIEGAALTGVGVLLAACAWLALAAGFVAAVFPGSAPVVQLVVFALINLAGALGCLRLAARRSQPLPASVHPVERTTTERSH